MSMPKRMTYMQPEGLRKVGQPHARWRFGVWGGCFWRRPRNFMSCGTNDDDYEGYGFCPSPALPSTSFQRCFTCLVPFQFKRWNYI